MMNKLSIIMLSILLTACSNSDITSKLPDNRPDYRQSKSINTLEIPPDLTSSSIDDTLIIPEFSGASNASLTEYDGERGENQKSQSTSFEAGLKNIHRSGDARWIVIESKPANVWKDLVSYWTRNGIKLSRSDEAIGIMETDWLESTNNGPKSGAQKLLGLVFSSLSDSGVRDKYRIRIDFDGQKTYVYLTHYGATEEAIDNVGKAIKGKNVRRDDSDFAWISSERNPELEVEMLRRLSLYLEQQKGKKAIAANDVKKTNNLRLGALDNGTPALTINSDYNQAWILLGIAIDRAGFEISEQNRKEGSYIIAKVSVKKVGFILSEIEKTIETYHIRLADQGEQQIAIVQTADSKPPSPPLAQSVLQKISKEIVF